ncbi:hypothetical protein LPH50_05945 [Xylella taiwanensis]|uniref:Uncharacterized protein n=1 Tax=Xylella taiwanensis TaxID=1444770 RepID=Z9JHW4_9GAMM|nr:hypothetical protein [Xylella taiwanensis]EWS77411.1 hypothetical protein AF72_11180 [Xylella taiwanensis]MCD8455512.1 hypothetical protein [Xylella taiwanensis]MCD8457919.1 hypothetical protein [Xylella taiwanensis]MCD8460054.1 hypothetical protein [Xylella taiwanensis]MCD8463886.1 hypothetical protein [Xylella taiwanensis]
MSRKRSDLLAVEVASLTDALQYTCVQYFSEDLLLYKFPGFCRCCDIKAPYSVDAGVR